MLTRRKFCQSASLGALGLIQSACTAAIARQGPDTEEWGAAGGLFPFENLDTSDVTTATVTWDLLGSYELTSDELATLVNLLASLEAPALGGKRDVHLLSAAFELKMVDGSVCTVELGTTTGAPYGYVDDGDTYLMMEAAYLLINGVEHDMYVDDVASFADLYTACTDKLRAGLPEVVCPFAGIDAAGIETIRVESYYPSASIELNAEQIGGLLDALEGMKLASATAEEPYLVMGGFTYLLWLTFTNGKQVRVYVSNGDYRMHINSVYVDIIDESCNAVLDYCKNLF